MNLPPRSRDIAMVFQNYALYPHMNVAENMGFALKIAKLKKSEITARVQEAAKILDLEDYLQRKPGQLSGGQRQRVAMGRAIVRKPHVFLMDEPLSNLDAKLRVATRSQIAALQRRLGITTLYVTHDQVEAMTMGDRVAVMKDGVLQQVDVPRVLYDSPVNAFVAGFIGSPPMNLIEGTIGADGVMIGSSVVKVPRGLQQAAGTGAVTVACDRRRSSSTATATASRPSSTWSRSSAPRPTSTASSRRTRAGRRHRGAGHHRPDRPQPGAEERRDDQAARQRRIGASLRRRDRRPDHRKRHADDERGRQR